MAKVGEDVKGDMNMQVSRAPEQLPDDFLAQRIVQTTRNNWLDETALSNLVDFPSFKKQAESIGAETFSVVDLRERGWTKKMMDVFLKVSDIVPVNGPVVGRPKLLYLKSLVLSIEAKECFQARRLAAAPRRVSSNALYCDKATRLVAMAQQHKFELPDLTLTELKLHTVQKFGACTLPTEHLRNEILFLAEPIESAFSELTAFKWNYGVLEARKELRKRIYIDVIEKYPHLSRTILNMLRLEMA